MRTFLTISILITVFAICIIIKIPYLTNEVHYNNHGHIITLTTLEIWDEAGITNCNFSPIQTWNNEGDKFISYYKRLEDDSGNNYFVSYPPFAFIFPYIIMKIFYLGASQNLLIWLSILIHIFSGFLIFICINKYLRNKIFEFSIPAFLELLTFMFFPPLLFQSVNYFPELLVIPLILMLILIIISVENRKNDISLRQQFVFGLIVFLMVYTDWLGLFVAFSFVFYLIRFKSRNLIMRKFLWPTVISSSMSLLLIFAQYVELNPPRRIVS